MIYTTIIIVTICIITIIFNTINIAVLYKTRKLPQNSRYFMQSLAVADLSVGILSAFGIYPSVNGYWPYGELGCRTLGAWWSLSCGVSLYSLFCISIERFVALNYPLRYHTYVTRRRCAVSIALLWTITFCWAAFLSTRDPSYYNYNHGCYMCVPLCSAQECKIYKNIGGIFFSVIPSVVMPCIYANIIYLSLKHQKQMKLRRNTISDSNGHPDNFVIKVEGKRKRNFRAAKLSLVVTGALYISWIPFTIKTTRSLSFSPQVEFVITWLAFSNSLWNFVIYSAMNKGFRATLVRLFQTLFCRKTYVEPFTSDSRSIENGLKTIG